jgi:arylamine N-acetyltransferase
MLNLPYSVERFTATVLGISATQANPRDGAMLWSILKPAAGNCGSAQLASPGTIGKKLSGPLRLVDDPMLQSTDWK